MIIYFRMVNGKVKRHHVYVDQIMVGSAKQSSAAVMTMFESCMEWISVNLPFMKDIYLQSDQAGCYNSNLLKMMIGLNNFVSGIKVRAIVHTGVQSGKGLIDAHFAHAARHVQKYLLKYKTNKRVSIATEAGLYHALSQKGMQNHGVQLLEIDNDSEVLWTSWMTILEPALNQLKKTFSTCAEIMFDHDIEQESMSVDVLHEKLSSEKGITLKFRAFAYSGIDGTNFDVRLFTQNDKRMANVTRDSTSDDNEFDRHHESQQDVIIETNLNQVMQSITGEVKALDLNEASDSDDDELTDDEDEDEHVASIDDERELEEPGMFRCALFISMYILSDCQ